MNLQAPVIIVGTHRSGTTWLGQAFSRHPDLAYWSEPRYVWEWGNNYRSNDLLTNNDAKPKIISHIHQRFNHFVQQHNKIRLIEKTPSNCLRLSFINAVYPEAKIIHIIRDGRSVFSSTNQIINDGYYRPEVLSNRMQEMLLETPLYAWPAYMPKILDAIVSKFFNRTVNFWGPRPPGWQSWVNHDSCNIILAKQWVNTIEKAIKDGKKINPKQYIKVYYEDLIVRPNEIVKDIFDFAELKSDQDTIDYICQTADRSKSTKWQDGIEDNILLEIRPYLEPTLNQLGYQW
jgi:hypothetical protein